MFLLWKFRLYFSLRKDCLYFSCALDYLCFYYGKFVYSFHYGKFVYAFQICMCSVQKLYKLILHYFYTYSFDFVLHFSFLNRCVGW